MGVSKVLYILNDDVIGTKVSGRNREGDCLSGIAVKRGSTVEVNTVVSWVSAQVAVYLSRMVSAHHKGKRPGMLRIAQYGKRPST